MRLALIGIGLLVGLIALCLLVGALLPSRHIASVAATFEQDPKDVFSALVDWREFTAWRRGLDSVAAIDSVSGNESWLEVSSSGTIPYEVVLADSPRQLVVEIATEELPFGGTWTYLLEPQGGGTRLTITEQGEVRNAVFRFMGKFVFGHHGTIETYLRDLGGKFGETVELERLQ